MNLIKDKWIIKIWINNKKYNKNNIKEYKMGILFLNIRFVNLFMFVCSTGISYSYYDPTLAIYLSEYGNISNSVVMSLFWIVSLMSYVLVALYIDKILK